MVMNDTDFFFTQAANAKVYMERYKSKNKEKINAARRERYRRQKLTKPPSTPKKKLTSKERNALYYYSHHEQRKEYQRKYAKANYVKNREKILERKRLKRLREKNTDCKKPKENPIDLTKWQSIPYIVACNAKPEHKLSTIVNLL